ncbi:MAG: type II toxin-antitoxin system ParD family antitoxin [Rhodoferax sp.]|nr:type II toxin-antitoxin system ParD family antitoxin [Rhodoferax sp.]
MPTRNVVLTDHQSQLVDHLVHTGRYQNASEVLREGLRLIERRDLEYERRLEALRAAIHVGIADFDAGNFQSFDTPAALSAHLAALTDEVLSE